MRSCQDSGKRALAALHKVENKLSSLDILRADYREAGVAPPAKLQREIHRVSGAYKHERQRVQKIQRKCGTLPFVGQKVYRTSHDAIAAAKRGAERERKRLRLPPVPW
jgi:hypothetical protein